MKFCIKCNKAFTDDKNFCPECGEKLIANSDFDIFGEPLHETKTYVKQDKVVYSSNKESINQNPYKDLKNKKAEILAITSIVLWLFPTIGFGISSFALYLNFLEYKLRERNKGYIILSIISVILSIIWEIILIKYGILTLTK